MGKDILNKTLEIVIYMSALLSVWKPQNKILYVLFKCIYCILISMLPVLFISIFIVILNWNESINIEIVIAWVSYLVIGTLVYLFISNRNGKRIEDYLLLGALYIKAYIDNKPQIKKDKSILVVEIMHFVFLFIALLWGIVSLIAGLEILSGDTFMIGLVISLFLAYILFVYGKFEVETRQRRKTILGIFISVIWLIIVCVRCNHYLRNLTQIGLEDMFILFFSVVFTIPTIYEWIKYIPAKLVKMYSEAVYSSRNNILEKHNSTKNECKKLGMQFRDELNECRYTIINEWENGERKRIITIIFGIIIGVGIVFVIIWGIDNLITVMDGVEKRINIWYANLNDGIQEKIKKIFNLLCMIGLMIGGGYIVRSNYTSKQNKVEKWKCITFLIIVELILGVITVKISLVI